ncbi:hypothetical protein COCNU_03G007110 [Cocos nucifera]|uniref:Uncharacterized protein n=1 Tax=Cocos nucifera TaxID=13894 RepID=A0A8K0I2C9_COCNU|nr:hypothetical protein COCNU_03G007110 [Cocos nucifera]
MACAKALTLVLIFMVVLSSSLQADGAERPNNECFCMCMIDQCMQGKDASREKCQDTCDKSCREAGHLGRIDESDYCGY